MGFQGQHIISIGDFSPADIRQLLHLAHRFSQQPQPDLFAGKLMATLFFEPSTRTRLSFEAAMQKCGGRVIGFSEASMTSTKKGESLADTIRMVEQYADVIVLRHPRDGSARLASEVSSIPVINGGDGANQHPSQTFLDLFTIDTLFPGRLETHQDKPLVVAFAGDLRYGRTVHSLLAALSHFPVKILCCAPRGLEMPEHHIQLARKAGVEICDIPDLATAVREADILYMTRLQEERFPDPIEFDHVKSTYRLTARLLRDAQPSLRILHPLPRINEIDRDVDSTPHAYYFPQAGTGIPVRQALLALVLGKELSHG
ncbi:MAG: aspartate carbamoyltransferase [Planctomycetota bacterium]|nr:MAG: aspartate carbamoyltransferase [Planctomycetota bacterium]